MARAALPGKRVPTGVGSTGSLRDPLVDGAATRERAIRAVANPGTRGASVGAARLRTAEPGASQVQRSRCALAVLPTVVLVRSVLRRSDDLEAAVARLVVRANVQRPLARCHEQAATADAVRDALRILGRRDDDHVVHAVTMFVLAVRQDWAAQLICGVVAAAGLRRVHAWFAADGCVIGDVEAQPWVHYGEQFSLEHRPQRRRAPLGASPSRRALHPTA